MRINGEWFVGEDFVARPLLHGKVQGADKEWRSVEFLIDTGADQTVLSADVLAALGFEGEVADRRIIGAGGGVESVVVETTLRFTTDAGAAVEFHGRFAAVTHLGSLDESVLGRDILDLFALIVDRPGDVVCLLSQRHQYTIQQSP